jgi:hypothetical protein
VWLWSLDAQIARLGHSSLHRYSIDIDSAWAIWSDGLRSNNTSGMTGTVRSVQWRR